MDDHLRYLKTLGLKPGATADQVREAYRDSVKVWHPDRFEHDPRLRQKAQERLKEINEAFERLRNYTPSAGPESGATKQRSGPRAAPGSDRAAQEPRKSPPRPAPEPPPVNRTASAPPLKSTRSAWLIGLGLVVLFVLVRSLDTTRVPKPMRSSVPPSAIRETQPDSTPTPRAPSQPNRDRASPTKTQRPVAAPARPEGAPSPVRLGSAGIGSSPPSDLASTATPAQDQLADPGTPPPRLPNRFTVGSTWDDVLSIQGTPDRFTSDSLHYGTSDVFFQAKRVAGWYNGYPKLKVRLEPSGPTATLSHFTINSTWDEVLAVQGTPDRFTSDSLHYGTSDVFFENGRVVNWYNGYPKLRVRLEPGR